MKELPSEESETATKETFSTNERDDEPTEDESESNEYQSDESGSSDDDLSSGLSSDEEEVKIFILL
jgi:hypothetical protein